MSICTATLDNVNRMSGYLREGLEKIRPRFPFFVGIRQKGLVMGLQFDSPTTSWLMMRALYENGIWAIVAAFDETVIQFKPGLLVDTAYCDEVLHQYERACIWYVANAGNIMMETHTDIVVVNRAQQFARAALPDWGFANAELELIKHRENTVYRINLPDGRSYALRVHRAGYHSAAEIESEIEWMRALAGDGIPTPTPIGAVGGQLVRAISVGDGEPRNCSVFTWHEGVLFDNLGDVENGMLDELVDRYRQLGALAAQVHNQSEHWQAPANFARHSWDASGLLGEEPLWGRFWEHPLMTAAQRRLVLKARIVLRELLEKVGQSPDCYGLIHADFLPDNILVHDGQLCLIDFDDCGYGWHMFEMATSVFPKITEPYFDSLVDAYVAGYRTQRTFTDEHLEIFPAFILLRGLTYLGWLMTRAESLVNRDRIAQEIINGICDQIPELLEHLNPLQRVGVDFMAWRQARQLARDNV